MLGAFFSGAVRGGNPASVVNQAADLIEEQMGDPGMPREALALDNETEKNIQEFLSRPSRGPKIARPRLALAALDVAKSHIGNSRENPATRVKQYLALFGLPFQYPDGTYVPFCAAGVGFVSAQAYRHITRQPSNLDDSNTPLIFRDSLTDVKRDWTKAHPSCREMMKASQDAGTWLSPKDARGANIIPKPGWLVFYNWTRGAVPQHVGIVDRHATAHQLPTVEFNTGDRNFSNGGAVLARKRDYDTVIGYIDTYREPGAPR